MTATYKSISEMAEKSPPAEADEGAFAPGAQIRRASHHQPAEETTLARAEKIVVLQRRTVPSSFTAASHQDKEISCCLS